MNFWLPWHWMLLDNCERGTTNMKCSLTLLSLIAGAIAGVSSASAGPVTTVVESNHLELEASVGDGHGVARNVELSGTDVTLAFTDPALYLAEFGAGGTVPELPGVFHHDGAVASSLRPDAIGESLSTTGISANAIPESSSLVLFAVGGAGLCGFYFFHQRRRALAG
jgi:hypothetical protein